MNNYPPPIGPMRGTLKERLRRLEELSKPDSVKKGEDELVGLVYAVRKWGKKSEIFLYVDGEKDLLVKKKSNKAAYIDNLCYHKDLLYHSVRDYWEPIESLICETLSGKVVGQRIRHVSALCSHNGKLYDASYDTVFETFSEKEVAKRHRDVNALCSHKGVLYDGGNYDCLYETFTGEKAVETKSYIHDLCSHKGVLYSIEENGKFYKTLSREELSKKVYEDGFLYSFGDNLWGLKYREYKNVVDMLDNKQVLEINHKGSITTAMRGIGKEFISQVYSDFYAQKPKQFIKYFQRHSKEVQEAIIASVFKYESENEMINKFLEKEYSDLLRDVTLKDM
ncbi:MAG: hypothetical protein ISS23_02670 [Nanoarchaeota archaeon]|nr:hypothetical protein [Nanoarchaeota archaeon]